ASGSIEREHQLGAQTLAIGVLLNKTLKGGDEFRCSAERQPGVVVVLGRRESQLLEPRNLVVRERELGELDQCLAAPEIDGCSQVHCGRLRVACGQALGAFAAEPLELGEIDLV